MLTRSISFCGRVAFNIIDADFKARTLRDLDERFGCGVVRRHYDRFDPVHTPGRLTRSPHAVCLRSNGNPYFLFLTRCGRKSLAIFVDKKVQSGYAQPRMIVAPFQMRAPAFDDNVMEGEMVRDSAGDWVFLVNDAPGLGGRRSTEPFDCRLRRLTGLLEGAYTPSATDVCTFQVKRFVSTAEAGDLVHGLAPSLPYTSRGLLFKPLTNKGAALDVLYNFDDTIVRTPVVRAKVCKDRVLATLAELCVVDTAPKAAATAPKAAATAPPPPSEKRELHVVRGTGPDTYVIVGGGATGLLRIATLAQSRAMRGLFTGVAATRSVPLACTWDPVFKRWTPTTP